MALSRPEISRRSRRKQKALKAAVGKRDAALLPVSLSDVRDFCLELGTLAEWDDADPKAIAKAHGLAMALALKLLGRAPEDDDDGNGR